MNLNHLLQQGICSILLTGKKGSTKLQQQSDHFSSYKSLDGAFFFLREEELYRMWRVLYIHLSLQSKEKEVESLEARSHVWQISKDRHQ